MTEPWRETELCAQHPEDAHWLELVEQAWRTNRQRDQDDRRAGWAPPTGSPFMLIRTGLEALSAGIATADWACVAEGFVMLQQVELGLRPALLAAHERHYPRKQNP